tara:strand:+ start:2360 stop:2857 length:498 start_codon:yes stop_codon:yes gene_type:complete
LSKIYRLLFVAGSTLLAIGACREAAMQQSIPNGQIERESVTAVKNGQGGVRWYSKDQISLGAAVFSQNCAECHGIKAEGIVENWRRRLEDGSFPAPPLNGTAHSWHHPTSMLLQVINYGGAPYGGNMPSFETVLEDKEKLASIAYFQNFWTDEIYAQWERMGGTN